jgi:hypothetical protein
MIKTALIDGDIVVYSAGFANNERTYHCEDGSMFRYKKDAAAHCAAKGFDISSIERRDAPGFLDFALANIRILLNKILEDTECVEYKIFLSGDDNWRRELAPSYKANRDATHKPVWFEEMKDYLILEHDAIVTKDGMEADDFLGLAQDVDTTVICTLDKDLDQIPGWHYNWKSRETYYVTSDESNLFFWMQMLMGDSADNIKGIYGIGPVRAKTMLDSLPYERRKCLVGLHYALAFDDPEAVFTTNAKLLYINR